MRVAWVGWVTLQASWVLDSSVPGWARRQGCHPGAHLGHENGVQTPWENGVTQAHEALCNQLLRQPDQTLPFTHRIVTLSKFKHAHSLPIAQRDMSLKLSRHGRGAAPRGRSRGSSGQEGYHLVPPVPSSLQTCASHRRSCRYLLKRPHTVLRCPITARGFLRV